MDVSDYLVSCLAAQGVRHIFGYPGSPLVPLLAAIERHPDVEFVLMRHENSGALAAGAHARLTGGLGVCLATSGPGALNIVCGVADAHLDRVPLLALTGLVPTERQGHWEFQDVDQTRVLGGLLSRSVTCVNAAQLTALVRNLIGHARQRNEAVHLALPSDVLMQKVDLDDDLFELDPARRPAELRLMAPPAAALDGVAAELAQFRQVAIVAGRRAVGCGAALEALAERLGAPLLTSLDGKGIVDESHPHSLGVMGIFGFPGADVARDVLRACDAVLAFGVDTEKPFLTEQADVQRRALVECEADPSWLTQEYHRSATLVGPLDQIATGLCERLPRRTTPSIMDELARKPPEAPAGSPDATYTDLGAFLMRLGEHLRADTTVVLDTGAHTVWAARYLRLSQRQRVLVSSRLGTMGFSLPAAVAAQLADPDGRVVALCGDGGFQMVAGELATMVQYGLPVVVVVIANGVLANVLAQQAVPYGTILRNPDFAALARACGANGLAVDGTSDVDTVLQAAFAERDRPTLVEVRCDPAVMAPLSRWEPDAAARLGD